MDQIWIIIAILSCASIVDGFRAASRLYDTLMSNETYNKLIRPVDNNSESLTVFLGLRLSQLIDVNEKLQIVTTNVWVEQEWYDNNLVWDPDKYSGVKMLYIPSDKLWLPDIVLYNNADGKYELTIMTKATVYSNGLVRWVPPAVYKSSCEIDVEFFPFDEQDCTMQFGSWTYDGNKVNIKHIMQKNYQDYGSMVNISYAIDLKDFYTSVEFDILGLKAVRNEKYYPCCQVPYTEVIFTITLRRKTLFYTVNLIMPCVAISFLTVLVFYLPSQSGEKISLSISILLSLTVFFLLLAEIIPPTSIVVPLIGKYLLFTMILVSLSIIVTVIVLNVHFRSPDTHHMPKWIRKIFINVLPRLLLMRRPDQEEIDPLIKPPEWEWGLQGDVSTFTFASPLSDDCDEEDRRNNFRQVDGWPGKSHISLDSEEYDAPPQWNHYSDDYRDQNGQSYNMHSQQTLDKKRDPKIQRAIQGVRFIAEHLKHADAFTNKREDWKYVAMVLDRLFLWVFTTACVISSMGIILQAPTLYDNRQAMTSDNLPNFSDLIYYRGRTSEIATKIRMPVP